jgi:hypothetical protein
LGTSIFRERLIYRRSSDRHEASEQCSFDDRE